MANLKYTIIKNSAQYRTYCAGLEALTESQVITKEVQDEIELLTFLIQKWDEEHTSFQDSDPVELLKYLMKEHKLRPKNLALILHKSKSLISDILHYRKGLSKEVIRDLAEHFKLSQEAFNRAYPLIPAHQHTLKKETGKQSPIIQKPGFAYAMEPGEAYNNLSGTKKTTETKKRIASKKKSSKKK